LLFMPIRIASLQPDNELIQSLDFLKEREEGVVLSITENGYWIRNFAEKDVFIDDFKNRMDSDLEEKFISLMMERNLDQLMEEFDQRDIRYILIDTKTKQLFRGEDEGILLLLKYTDSFKNIYEEDGIDIWEFLGARTRQE